jgi:Mn2+/Fe2+ NRAMP family transporter
LGYLAFALPILAGLLLFVGSLLGLLGLKRPEKVLETVAIYLALATLVIFVVLFVICD